MKLKQVSADLSRLKIVILATPKTGNTWLRSLLHYVYDLPIIGLPLVWSADTPAQLPERFVCHQHLPPSEDLFRWLIDSRVVVFSTIRHPGDTFLSFFHYLKWQDTDVDPKSALVKFDGERPGANSLLYVQIAFTQVYALSLLWARLGSHVVRYEDLLSDPLSRLRELTSRIAPVEEERLKTAVFLSRPDHMSGSGMVDPRHLRTTTAGAWRKELPLDIVETMRRIQPYASVCRDYGYDWNPTASAAPLFDYGPLDPFGGRQHFDNGEAIGWGLRRMYVFDIADARRRWPDPTQTEGDSFWNWLRSPDTSAASNAEFPASTLTNLMQVIYRMRPDLQQAMPDPEGRDRLAMLTWFLGQAGHELAIPWGLIEPVLEGHATYLEQVV